MGDVRDAGCVTLGGAGCFGMMRGVNVRFVYMRITLVGESRRACLADSRQDLNLDILRSV
jgi:hypothetical protein